MLNPFTPAQAEVIKHHQGLTSDLLAWFVGSTRDDDSFEVIALGPDYAWSILFRGDDGDHTTSEATLGEFTPGITV